MATERVRATAFLAGYVLLGAAINEWICPVGLWETGFFLVALAAVYAWRDRAALKQD